MRPLREQVILITGATDGLGKAVAMQLARTGATLLLHGRDEARGERTPGERGWLRIALCGQLPGAVSVDAAALTKAAPVGSCPHCQREFGWTGSHQLS